MFVNSYNVRTFAANLKQGILKPQRMTLSTLKRTVFTVLFLSVFSFGFAKDAKEQGDDEKFDAKSMIMHHVKDAYGMHIITFNEGKEDEKHITIPLPVILWTDNGLTTFMSSEFHHDYHGHEVVEKNGGKFVNVHVHKFLLITR